MKVAKTLALGLAVLFISSSISANEMSNQMMMCEFDEKEILITAPMPFDWSDEEKERACLEICNSMKLAGPARIIKPPTQKEKLKEVEATCDTDYNCEVLWEKYKTYNIKSIFTAPDNRQRNTKHDPNVLEITCSDSEIKRYIATETELSTVCTSNNKLLLDIEEFAKESGETEEFTLNWEQLEFMIEAGIVSTDRLLTNKPHKNAQTVADLITFMKKHPETIASGVYKNEAKAKELCDKADKPSSKKDQCFKENYGIHISTIMVRFGDSDEVPRWFSDFCSLNNLLIIEHTRGFWECSR